MKSFFFILSWILTLVFLGLAIISLITSQIFIGYMMVILACMFLPPLYVLLAMTGKNSPWLVRVLLLFILVHISELESESISRSRFFRQPRSSATERPKPSPSSPLTYIPLAERKLIWKELTLIGNDDDPRQAKQNVLRKYRLTNEELSAIQREASSNHWPPARPTPTPRPPKDLITQIVRRSARPVGKISVEFAMLSQGKSGVQIDYVSGEERIPAWTRDGIIMNVREIMKAIALEPELDIVRHYEIYVWLMAKDELGTDIQQQVVSVKFSQETAKKIDWDITPYDRFQQIVQLEGELWIHPMLLK